MNSPGRTPRRQSLSDARVLDDTSYGAGDSSQSVSISQSWAAPDPRVLTITMPSPEENLADPPPVVEPEEDDEGTISPPTVANDGGNGSPQLPTKIDKVPYDPTKVKEWAALPVDPAQTGYSRNTDSAENAYPRLPPGCTCSPSIEEIQAMPLASRKRVENFALERAGYGSVRFFADTVDTTSLDLTAGAANDRPMVIWEGKEGACIGVELYPDPDNKPARGDGLNKPAEITLCFAPGWKETTMRASIEEGQEDGDKRSHLE